MADFDLQPDGGPSAPQFDLQPEPDQTPPADLTAFRAARAGVQPEQAGQALALSKRTGLAPQFVADNLPEVQQNDFQASMADALAGMPVTQQYAGQSAVHASAVKNDVGMLEALEMGFSDVGYALRARSLMDSGDAADLPVLQGYEQSAADFAARPAGALATIARALPTLGIYAGAGVVGPIGVRAAMYQLNRGVLYRKIWAQAPIPETDADGTFDAQEYDARAKEFAWKGASVGAAIAGAFGDWFTSALPGAGAALSRVGVDIVSKGWGEVAKDWVGHTLSGALMMGASAAIDDGTVQKATTGKIDLPEALHAGGEAFKDGLLVAGAVAALGPGRKLLTDLGRIHDAPVEAAHLDALVDHASKLSLPKEEAEHLVGKMASQSATPTVYIDGEKAIDHAAKLVELLGDEGAQALAEAQATGGDVAVPIEKYVTGMGEEHAALREDVKLSPDGLTPRQAEESRKALADALPEAIPLYESPQAKEARESNGRMLVLVDANRLAEAVQRRMKARGDETPLAWNEARAEKAATFEKLTEAPHVYVDRSAPDTAVDVADGRHRIAEAAKRGGAIAVQVSPEDLPGLHELFAMRLEAKYGGTPEEWAKTLTPEIAERLRSTVAEPKPLPTTQIDGRAAADWASELIDTKTVAEIQPGRYELAARRAEDQLAEVAKESAEKGQAAARQGFLAAGMRELDSAAPDAGDKNLTDAGRKADAAQRRLAKLPMLERARDLARAMAKQAADVREEMDKARAYLDSRDSDKYRADLAKAGPEYLNAFNAILDSVDDTMAGSQRNSGALDAVLKKMQAQGALVGFDEQGLREIMDGAKGWKQLTPPEARNVLDAVKNIRKAAHDANEIALSDQKLSLREFVGSVTAEASTRKDLGAPPLTDSAASPAEGIARGAGLFNAANLKPETIFERLGKTALRFYEDKLIAARNRKAELQGEHLRYFVENFDKEMRGLRSWLREPVKTALSIPSGVDLDGTKINNETLAMAFLNLGSPGNEQRLLSGYGWDKAQLLEEIGKNVPKEKLRFLQGILAYNDEKIWPLVRDHAQAHTGVAPPKVERQPITIHFPDGTSETFDGGYFPAAPNRRALGVPLQMQSDVPGGVETDQAARMTVQASFTKARTKTANYPIDLNWSRYPSHLASVFHFLAYDDAVRDVGKLLRDDEFQRTTRHYVGEPMLQQLQQDQRVWARGSVGDASSTLSYLDQLFAKVLRSRAVSNALAFSTPIALGQESHIQYAVASGEISLKNATAAMTRQLPFTDTWTATRAILDEVRFRSDRYADQFREAISGQPARTMLGHGVDRAAFAQMEAADAMISHIIGDAALNDALEKKLPMEDAVREANRKVRLLMPTHNVMEMAPIVRSKGTIGALSLFRGLPNVVWNVESGLYDEARQSVAGASGVRQIAAAGGRVALNTARAVASVAVLHMLGRLLMGHGKKDEDGEAMAGWGTWAEREALASQFSRIPLGRDVAEPIIDAVQHDKPIARAIQDIRIAPDLAVVQGIVKDLGKIASDSTASEDKVQAAVNTALTALGAGARPITRAARYAYDAQQGNVDVRGPGDALGGVLYGQRPRQEKNLPVAAQDLVSGE